MATKVLIPQVNRYAAIVLIKMIRMLDTRDIVIVGCDPSAYGLSSGSMLVDRFVQSPALINETTDRDFLLTLCEDESIDLMIPFIEQELTMVASKPHDFPVSAIPSIATLELLLHKLHATEAMQSLGIPVPQHVKDMFLAPADIVVRKNHSVGSKGIFYANLDTDKQIVNWFRSDAFAQERVFGDEYTVDVFTDPSGEPKLIIPRKRIQVRNGVSIVCQLEQQKDIIELCEKIYARYTIPGFSCVQFIVSENTPYFIELNPRIAGTAIAGVMASFNYMELFFRSFLEKDSLDSRDHYMQHIAWGSVISRRYEEILYNSGRS